MVFYRGLKAANLGEVTTLSSIEYMQELTSAICTHSSENETNYLMDNRDTRTYRVTKLKDGNCWMTQNLDYNDPNSTRITDVSKWTSTDANYRAYYDPGDSIIGNYYSWQSATNNTGGSSGNASGSICPSGWKLPTSNSTGSGSFGGLMNAYSIANTANEWDKVKAGPLYFVAGGFVNSGSLQVAGERGYYWSSTVSNNPYAYILYFLSSGVSPSATNGRYYGLSVRCLVQGS